MTNQDPNEEKHLQDTLQTVNKLLREKSTQVERSLDEITQFNFDYWQNKAEMDDIEKFHEKREVEKKSVSANSSLKEIRNLRLAQSSPYFGKIVFIPKGSSTPLDIYIGKISIMDGLKFYTYDWRSPIANLFYKEALGNTSYQAPIGVIEGELTSRRQYKIVDGKIQRMIDSGIYLQDDALQETLSQSSSDKMKNIVTTIQEEQNEIVRNNKTQNVIVQGSSGSGKTAVALHRLAYLLYQDKNVTSENMLIFSPNKVFSKYISNVLPELGEDLVPTTTFSEWQSTFLKSFKEVETFAEFIERCHSEVEEDEEEKRKISFQFQEEYHKAMDRYLKRRAEELHFNRPIKIYHSTWGNELLNYKWKQYQGLSVQERLEELTRDVCGRLKLSYRDYGTAVKNKLKRGLLPTKNIRSLYQDFLSSPEFVASYGKKLGLDNKKLSYPDSLGALYLTFELFGYPENKDVRYVSIDEVQDYSPLQMQILKNSYRGATFTVLGDVNQRINPFSNYQSLEEFKKILGADTRYFELNKCYRSSPEITEYGNEILGINSNQTVRVKNDTPVVKKEVPKEKLHEELVRDIVTMKTNGLNRIAIITKEGKEAKAIYEALKDDIEELSIIIREDDSTTQPTLVLPSYLAKGLEFDAVISYNNESDRSIERNSDRYLYYIACTRAQHNLVVYNPPESVKKKCKI